MDAVIPNSQNPTGRRVLGMPTWGYWVVVLLIAGAIGNIPVVGQAVMMAALIAAFIYWLRQPKVHKPGVQPITRAEPFLLNGSQEVVGESFYQEQIDGFVRRNGRRAAALLTHEPKNKHSANRTAVRVDLARGTDYVTCGYLPAYISGSWVPVLQEAARNGAQLYCDAEIRGGYESAPNFGVWLHQPGALKPPRSKRRGPRFEPTPDAEEQQSVRDFWANQPPSGEPLS